MRPTLKKFGKTRISYALVTLFAVFTFGSLAGCGGAQTPPRQDGECHPWRVWVPPTQNADGDWTYGYCRDR